MAHLNNEIYVCKKVYYWNFPKEERMKKYFNFSIVITLIMMFFVGFMPVTSFAAGGDPITVPADQYDLDIFTQDIINPTSENSYKQYPNGYINAQLVASALPRLFDSKVIFPYIPDPISLRSYSNENTAMLTKDLRYITEGIAMLESPESYNSGLFEFITDEREASGTVSHYIFNFTRDEHVQYYVAVNVLRNMYRFLHNISDTNDNTDDADNGNTNNVNITNDKSLFPLSELENDLQKMEKLENLMIPTEKITVDIECESSDPTLGSALISAQIDGNSIEDIEWLRSFLNDFLDGLLDAAV